MKNTPEKRNLCPTQRSVLIANRGEIACRVIHACRSLGLRTIAIYSEVDADSLHVGMADVAVAIESSSPAHSYLDIDKILQAGITHCADAVHPGYGFLSESSEFSEKVREAGMRWIGPAPETIDAMGDKARARSIAISFGVPVLPGSGRLSDCEEDWHLVAAEVGYPLLVKAVGGGGGIGMRLVEEVESLNETVKTAKALALRSFGNADVYLERYVDLARHIEVQVFGYGDGQAVHLYERECSLQRRFQKVVEETPAPGLRPEALRKMTTAAVALAKGTRYSGAGTVEFVVDARTQEAFFLEMNTRIQVEHAVSEMVTGWDLVQAQICLAFDEIEVIPQSEIKCQGAAIECRIYAENPLKKFFPSPGVLEECEFPAASESLRIDTGVRQGDRITPYYDPMIAKLVAHGSDREMAHKEMSNALARTRIGGVRNNVEFLRVLLDDPHVCRGDVDTGYIERSVREWSQRLQVMSNPA